MAQVMDDEIREVFRESDEPVLSTAEVAEELPMSRRGILNRLSSLREDNEIQKKDIGGRNTVWWIPKKENENQITISTDPDEYDMRNVKDRNEEECGGIIEDSIMGEHFNIQIRREYGSVDYQIDLFKDWSGRNSSWSVESYQKGFPKTESEDNEDNEDTIEIPRQVPDANFYAEMVDSDEHLENLEELNNVLRRMNYTLDDAEEDELRAMRHCMKAWVVRNSETLGIDAEEEA